MILFSRVIEVVLYFEENGVRNSLNGIQMLVSQAPAKKIQKIKGFCCTFKELLIRGGHSHGQAGPLQVREIQNQ